MMPVRAKLRFLLVAATNHSPQFASLKSDPNASYAILKRLELWKLENRFVTREKAIKAGMDPDNLPERVELADQSIEAELPDLKEAFMSIVRDHWPTWKERGSQKPEADSLAIMVQGQDTFQQFIDEHMVPYEGAFIAIKPLLLAFREFAREQGVSMTGQDDEALCKNFDPKLDRMKRVSYTTRTGGAIKFSYRRLETVSKEPKQRQENAYKGWLFRGPGNWVDHKQPDTRQTEELFVAALESDRGEAGGAAEEGVEPS
jgi:hypothetical protein